VKILCDQDVPEPVLQPLRHLLRARHVVDHVNQLGWAGKKDRYLLPDASSRGYDALITNDSNQLDDPGETDAIRRSGLHHIRYSQRHPGLKGLALAAGSILAAMPGVVEDLERADSQRLVRVTAISPHDRFEIIDPKERPPRYWR
jgi:hypothetical protein